MTKYDISLLGATWSVIALAAGEGEPESCPERTVYILPRLESDVCILTPERAEWELTMLLAFYYRELLGYPKCTLEVLSGGKAFEVEIFDTPPHLTGINIRKCKLLSTNMHRMPDLTEHLLYTACSGGVYRVIPVEHEDGFRPSVLSTLRVVDGLPTASAALGLADGTVILDADVTPTPALLSAAAVCHPDFACGEVTLTALGVDYTFLERDSLTTVLTPATLVGKSRI